MQNNALNLHYTSPTFATDGHSVVITEQGPVNLLFFQIRRQGPRGVDADVVASIRLHSVAELKELHRVIGETIKKHEDREP